MKKIINTKNAPAPVGPYNQAVLAGDTLYISGQIPIDPKTGELIKGSIAEETKQVMKNLEAILTEADMTFENVVKSSIFLSDMGDFQEVNAAYATYFNEKTAPARETIEVANLPKYVNIEISMIAMK